MSEEIKAGDVVKLKSSGPAMVVSAVLSVEEGSVARCVWFNGKAEPMTHSFNVKMLVAVA